MIEYFRHINDGRLAFHCPGCGYSHVINDTWTIKYNNGKPTVNPSILTRGRNDKGETICHMFIVDGLIKYLDDCTHELKGQIVAMIDESE
jgi:hypothetical protein